MNTHALQQELHTGGVGGSRALLWLACFLMVGLVLMLSGSAHANTAECTNDTYARLSFTVNATDPNVLTRGMMSMVLETINLELAVATSGLQQAIISNPLFVNSVWAAILLYITLYGVMITAALVEVKPYDIVVRLMKIALILSLFTNSSFIFGLMYEFFIKGSDDLINRLVPLIFGADAEAAMAAGDSAIGAAFQTLDEAAARVFSPSMFITIIASLTTGPYGPGFGILLILGIYFYTMALSSVLWVYLSSRIILYLLFALAPLFLSFILFDRTRPLFNGFISQMLHAILLPIGLLIAVATFSGLMMVAVDKILELEKCKTPVVQMGFLGDWKLWRFAGEDGTPDNSSAGFFGPISGDGAPTSPATTKQFPLDLIDILIFLMFGYLNWHAAPFVQTVLRGITDVIANFYPKQPFSGFFTGMQDKVSVGGQTALFGSTSKYGQKGIGGVNAGINAAKRHNPGP